MAEKRAKTAEGAAPDSPSFEQSLGELEGVVKQLENAELPLEKALELFEKGVQLSDACRKQLTEAETRVEILMKKGGGAEAVPFEEE
jgi:exodeoxyribonuclease VII small subunit